MVKTIHYRVGQFIRALTARVPEREMVQAVQVLTPAARALFRHQAVQDQHHALAVYRTLRQAGHTSPQLLAAALLHDVGKAAIRLPAWQRAIIVLLERFAPCLLARLGQGEPQESARPVPSAAEGSLLDGWRRSFVIHVHHPEIGARWAQEAGCSPLTVALIRQHHKNISLRSQPPSRGRRPGDGAQSGHTFLYQDKLTNDLSLTVESEKNQLLAALQAADNLN
jgi:hypothetical protein